MPGNPKCDMNRVPEACDMQVLQGAWYCQYTCPHRQKVAEHSAYAEPLRT